MTVEMRLEGYDPSQAIKFWKESGDEMLISLGESLEETKLLPTEGECIELLTFFSLFSMGCAEMHLKDLAETFNKRGINFIVGLRKVGLTPGKYKNYVRNTLLDGFYSRVCKAASNRVAYRMVDMNRNSEGITLGEKTKDKKKK